jgi:hypothetical protein
MSELAHWPSCSCPAYRGIAHRTGIGLCQALTLASPPPASDEAIRPPSDGPEIDWPSRLEDVESCVDQELRRRYPDMPADVQLRFVPQSGDKAA